jgi:hypothetical protein
MTDDNQTLHRRLYIYIVFRVKNINFTRKCNTGGALQKTRLYFTQFTPLSVLKKLFFYIKKDFRASRGILAHLVVF